MKEEKKKKEKKRKATYIYIYIAKLSTWCFEHSGDISCSLLVNPSNTDESWEGRNTCMWIFIYIYT